MNKRNDTILLACGGGYSTGSPGRFGARGNYQYHAIITIFQYNIIDKTLNKIRDLKGGHTHPPTSILQIEGTINNNMLLSGGGDKRILMWNTKSWILQHEFFTGKDYEGGMLRIIELKNSKKYKNCICSCHNGGLVNIWKLSEKYTQRISKTPELTFRGDGKPIKKELSNNTLDSTLDIYELPNGYLATIVLGNIIKIWNLEKTLSCIYTSKKFDAPLMLRFEPVLYYDKELKNTSLYVGKSNGNVQRIEFESPSYDKIILCENYVAHKKGVVAMKTFKTREDIKFISFGYDLQVAITYMDGTVQRIEDYKTNIYSVVEIGDNGRILSTSGKTIRMYDYEKNIIINNEKINRYTIIKIK